MAETVLSTDGTNLVGRFPSFADLWESWSSLRIPDGMVVQRYHIYLSSHPMSTTYFRASFDGADFDALPLTPSSLYDEGANSWASGGANHSRAIVIPNPGLGFEEGVYIVRRGIPATNFEAGGGVTVFGNSGWRFQVFATLVETRSAESVPPDFFRVEAWGNPTPHIGATAPTGMSRACEYGAAPDGAAYIQVLGRSACDSSATHTELFGTAPLSDPRTYAISRTDLPSPADIGIFRWLNASGDEVGRVQDFCFGGVPTSVCDDTPAPAPEPAPEPEGEALTIGIPYDSFIETLDLDQTNEGPSYGRRQSVARVRVHILNTRALRMGPGEGKTRDVPIRQFEPLGTPPEPFTGFQRVSIPREWDSNGKIRVESVDPNRMEVLSLMPESQKGDE